MAIDTAAKRASVQAYTVGLMRPPPSGTVGVGARATVAYFYSGLAYAAGAVVTFLRLDLRRILRNCRHAFDPYQL